MTRRNEWVLQHKKLQVAQHRPVGSPDFSPTHVNISLCAQRPVDFCRLMKHLGFDEPLLFFWVGSEAGWFMCNYAAVGSQQRTGEQCGQRKLLGIFEQALS